MSSWWRKYAEANGVTITGAGSWKRICALHFGATAGSGSWPRRMATLVDTAGSPGLDPAVKGSWTRRLVDGDAQVSGSAGRLLVLNGGRAPLP
jgi:hypothetical protein